MNNMRKRYGLYPYLALFILTASVTVRAVACLTAFDFRWGYYTSTLGAASAWIAGIGALILFSYIFNLNKDAAFIASYTSPATYIPTGLLATALFFVSKSLIQKSHLFANVRPSIASWVAISAGVIGILALGYFILCATIDERHNLTRANFGLFAVIFLCAYAAYLYFDTSLPINAPNKMLDQAAYLMAAIFFLYETRISLGREKWGAYIAFGFVAALICGYAAIPEIIVYFATGEVIADSIFETVLTLTVFIFITARVLIAGSIPEDRDNEFVTSLKTAAAKRQSEIDAIQESLAEIEPQAEDEPEQMSFDIPEAEAADEAEEDEKPNEEITDEENISD